MTIAVTGGAGFIGSMVCRRLSQRGDDVVVLDSLSHGRREFLDGLETSVSLLEVDIRDSQAVQQAITDVKPTAVCHLAAIHFIPYCNEHPQEAIETNIIGTTNVLEACRANPPEMIVVASSAAVYGISDRPHRESEPPQPLDIYGITKYCCEHLAQLYVSQTDAACVSARIFNAVGPNETNPHLVPHLVEQLNKGQTTVALGNLDPCRDYIDTQDLADALICLLDLRQQGHDVFNIGTGRETSVRDIVRMCEDIIKRSIKIEQKPGLVRKVERMHLCACIDKLHAATGWTPKVDLSQTLQDLLNNRAQ